MKCCEHEGEVEHNSLATQKQEYPYGLCIRLDTESIEKLGLKIPAIGDAFMVYALASVKYVSVSESVDAGSNKCLELQLTDLALTPYKGKTDHAKKLYGE